MLLFNTCDFFELTHQNSSFFISASKILTLQLKYPDIAIDFFNNNGYWSLIYNQVE